MKSLQYKCSNLFLASRLSKEVESNPHKKLFVQNPVEYKLSISLNEKKKMKTSREHLLMV